MQLPELIEPFVSRFERLAIPYMVTGSKLEYFREGGSEKHVRDIRSMLQISDIDRAAVESFVAARGLEREWQAVQLQ